MSTTSENSGTQSTTDSLSSGRQTQIKWAETKKYQSEYSSPPIPRFSTLLYLLAIVSLIAGTVFAMQLWPSEPEFGYSWKFAAYVPALGWMWAGIKNAIFLSFMGLVIVYLQRISMK